MKQSRFLIAAPASGSGKTSVTLGLLRALRNRGKQIQPFKCGPDYIDTYHHKMASGEDSINLDLFMSSEKHVQNTFNHYSQNKDVCIVEGVMGLFDGAQKAKGSSAEIAKHLNLPVILVVNAKATAYSIAPLLYGFKNFDENINLAGVIFNHVRTESHYQFLKEAAEDVGITSLGYIPTNDDVTINSRHLGLSIADDHNYEAIVENLSHHISSHINIDLLLETTACDVDQQEAPEQNYSKKLSIAVAYDDAFNFIYKNNLKILEQIGNIKYFSPIADTEIPPADMVYLAGGYPELYLTQLSENTAMQESMKAFVADGGIVHAECGGMMYLSNNIIDAEGNKYKMCGILDQDTTLEDMNLHLGYRKVAIGDQEFRGHEFHYSQIRNSELTDNIAVVYSARDERVKSRLWRQDHILASYIHFYWDSVEQFESFMAAAEFELTTRYPEELAPEVVVSEEEVQEEVTLEEILDEVEALNETPEVAEVAEEIAEEVEAIDETNITEEVEAPEEELEVVDEVVEVEETITEDVTAEETQEEIEAAIAEEEPVADEEPVAEAQETEVTEEVEAVVEEEAIEEDVAAVEVTEEENIEAVAEEEEIEEVVEARDEVIDEVIDQLKKEKEEEELTEEEQAEADLEAAIENMFEQQDEEEEEDDDFWAPQNEEEPVAEETAPVEAIEEEPVVEEQETEAPAEVEAEVEEETVEEEVAPVEAIEEEPVVEEQETEAPAEVEAEVEEETVEEEVAPVEAIEEEPVIEEQETEAPAEVEAEVEEETVEEEVAPIEAIEEEPVVEEQETEAPAEVEAEVEEETVEEETAPVEAIEEEPVVEEQETEAPAEVEAEVEEETVEAKEEEAPIEEPKKEDEQQITQLSLF
ncbi:cobyrinate a,c-diamide synthase [Puteibacter caeruleilacunae]|nr:cobyrinate a,c-diamide synthase [Puteibacter caeruleilacunae]